MTFDETTLWAEVLSRPGDDEALSVYADALIERGDARGEFIALQLDGSAEALQRAAALMRAHGEAWLGPLHFVLRNLVFERGLLVEAQLARDLEARAEHWREGARDRQLATVRRLRKSNGSVERLYEFYAGGQLRSLRCFELPDPEALQFLPLFAGSVREVAVHRHFPLERAGVLADLQLDALTVTGARHLSQWVDTFDRLQLLSRLTRLTCVPWSDGSFAEPLCDPRLWAGALRHLEVERVCLVKRTAEGFHVDFSSVGAQTSLELLARLPGTVRRVRCARLEEVLPSLQQELHAAAAARGVTIERLGSGA